MNSRVTVLLAAVLGALLRGGNLWGASPDSSVLSSVVRCLKNPSSCFSSSATPSSPSSSASPVLAHVGNEVITASDLQARIEQLPVSYQNVYATTPAKRQLLDSLVEEKIFVVAARREGLDHDENYRRQMAATENALLRQALTAHLGAVSDAEVAQYYKDHIAEFQAHMVCKISRLFVPTLSEAKKAQGLLHEGKSFETVQKSVSSHAGGPLQNPIDVVYSRSMVRGMENSMTLTLRKMHIGQLSAPFKEGSVYAIVRLEERHEMPGRLLAQSMLQIRSQLQSVRSAEWMQKAHSSVPVSIDVNALAAMKPSSPPQHPQPPHQH